MIKQARPGSYEMRYASRHSVDLVVTAEHRRLGEITLDIQNISAQGFMVQGDLDLQRGERLEVHFPLVGRMDALLVWSHDGRAGFQLERVIRGEDLRRLVRQFQAAA
ncbi:PilZ domain-containing protein [Novosphingobium mathurense]|uniref:PilZ domain-containing protein n=1 Tax=Novosphingobium mathurense TaxID=428990 RepID=A0A1U6IXB0_9SPHN|nr:PilZ domain-containing protein [Novosphingobium mathurense]SLK12646.1 PilZ domain-containing protein [Novosphingobium mathurense]